MSAKSYAESARSLSTASTSSTAATSVNADYPPILPKPITTAANKSDLANKALAVVAANTASSTPNVWAARMQNPRREERELRNKEEDYDPFVVRRFDHHAPPPAQVSTNGISAQAWPTIGNKPIRDKAQVKWPPVSSSSPSQGQNERSPSSSGESRGTKPAPVPVSNRPALAVAPTPPPPPSQDIPPPTSAPNASSKTYTFGSIHLESEARHKRQLAEAERKKQTDAAWNTVSKKRGKKDKKQPTLEVRRNGKETANESSDEQEPLTIENGLSPVLGVTGVPEPVMASLAIMFPPSGNKMQPKKRSPTNSKPRPKDRVASTRKILVGGDEEKGVTPSVLVNDVKWRFTVETDVEPFVKGTDTPPAGSGTLSPLVMDHTLAMLRSTQTSTPSFSPVVLSQTMGTQTPQSIMTPPVATSPIPSPPPNHQLFSQNGKPSAIPHLPEPTSAASDDFEVKDFGYGFGGQDAATVKRIHEQCMAEMERVQNERAHERERTGDEYSPNRNGDYTELNGATRGQRRGYGGRGYNDGRGRRGFNTNGRGGGRGMRYPPRPPFHDPNSPVSPPGDGIHPYPYPPHMPPYGYLMPFYPPGPYDYGAYYNYPPYMPQQSPATYSPSHFPLPPPPPPFDMAYPPPPPHITQSGPVPVPITRPPFPLDPLRYYLLGQVEYYLSPDNLVHDFFLRQQMDSQGFVPLTLIASFNRAQRLTTSVDLVKEVLSFSSIAEVRGDHVRMTNWQQWVLPSAAPSTVEALGNEEEEEVVFVMESSGETNDKNKNHGQSD